MEFYWSDKKCGDTAIVLCKHELWKIVQDAACDFFGDTKPIKYSILANIICNRARKQKLEAPFEHVLEETLKRVFQK